jgi:hypothetical protein
VHQATSKDPDDRYQSARELASDLGNVLCQKPVAAKFYRYRFDEKEIAAERPHGVLFTSFVFLFTAVIISLGILVNGSPNFQIIDRIIILLITSLAIIASCYVLTGHKWARLMAAILFGIFGLSLVVVPLLVYPAHLSNSGLDRRVVEHYLLPLFFYELLGLLHLYLVLRLYRHDVRSWFNFSQRLRSEHSKRASLRRWLSHS